MFAIRHCRLPLLKNVQVPSGTRNRSGPSLPSLKIYSFRRKIAEMVSNKYNEKRVEELGPELACLEWLMECGSTEVQMSDSQRITSISQMKEYIPHAQQNLKQMPTSLEQGELAYEKRWPGIPRVHIVKVDASDSAIADEGFKYFKELRRIESLKLNFCDYFGDTALRELALGRAANSLSNIEIVLNPCVTDASVYWLTRLKALRTAHFYFLPYVANRQAFIRQLKLALPRCKVTFPEAEQIGYGYGEEKTK